MKKIDATFPTLVIDQLELDLEAARSKIKRLESKIRRPDPLPMNKCPSCGVNLARCLSAKLPTGEIVCMEHPRRHVLDCYSMYWAAHHIAYKRHCDDLNTITNDINRILDSP